MFEAYIKFFEGYFDFKTRATRSEYWNVTLMNGLIVIILLIIVEFFLGRISFLSLIFVPRYRAAFMAQGIFITQIVFNLIANLFSLIVFIPTLALTYRRFHDIGRPGFLFFLFYIPTLVGIFAPGLLIFY